MDKALDSSAGIRKGKATGQVLLIDSEMELQTLISWKVLQVYEILNLSLSLTTSAMSPNLKKDNFLLYKALETSR